MEIISGVERRRRWRDEDKLRVLAEAEPRARTSEVARRYDISRGLLWYWRRQLRQGRLAVPGASQPMFFAVQVSDPEPAAPVTAVADPRIEIALPDGTCVRVGADAWMLETRGGLSHHNDVAKALGYALKRWNAFSGFLGNGRVCVANNAAERTLRGIALGRKA